VTGAVAQLADRGAGRCALSGPLTLEAAPLLWRELQAGGLLTAAAEVDLSGITDSDSAGLALLIAWRAARGKTGGAMTFTGLPQRLRLLAGLTGAGAALASPPAAPGA